MDLQNEIEHLGLQATMNSNELFQNWIEENLTLSDVLRRCPDVIIEIFEEFNNDWIEVVEAEADEMGIRLNANGVEIHEDGEEDNAAWDDGYQNGIDGDPVDCPSDSPYYDRYMEGYAAGIEDAKGVK